MHFKVYLVYTHLFFIHCSNAFDITTILSQHPSFGTFNHYISQTQLATEINSRQTITVLAVPNDAISSLSGKPYDVLKNLLSVHVVLDYYDVEKLWNLPNKTAQMTTLFQTTSQALGQQGFLKATILNTGSVVIGSVTQRSPLGAILVGSVSAEPYNISVLHISAPIVPVGMDCPSSDSNSTSPMQPPVPTPPRSPKMSLVPMLGPAHSPKTSQPPMPMHVYGPKMSSPLASSPKAVPSSAPTPVLSHAKGPTPSAPTLVPSHVKAPTPSANAPGKSPPALASPTTPSGSPTDAPASAESPPKPTDTPARSPPELADTPDGPSPKPADTNNAGSGTSTIRIGLDVVITTILSPIHLIVKT